MSDGLLGIAEVLLRSSEKRLETVSNNIANTATPGFKRQGIFQNALSSGAPPENDLSLLSTYTEFSQAALRGTGMPFDLALSGEGFFRLRDASGALYYSRNGQFERTADGLLRDSHGLILQTQGGSDVVISDQLASILPDGVILEGGLPVGRIGVFGADDKAVFKSLGGSLFAAEEGVTEIVSPVIRQGMLEAANVEMASEMIAMMEALRGAEMGARIAQTYDTLIDNSITTFGKGS